MEKEIYGIIYMIRNKINGKIYFGQTTREKGFNGRYTAGKWWIYTDNDHLRKSAKKYGYKNFEVNKMFDIAYSKEELDLLEDLYICVYNTLNSKYGYNKKRGGSSGKHSEETKQKQSHIMKKFYEDMSEEKKQQLHEIRCEINSNERNPFYGKNHTEEQKRKWSNERKGKNLGEENPNYGNTGENNPVSKTILVINLETGNIEKYIGIAECARQLTERHKVKYNASNIVNVCRCNHDREEWLKAHRGLAKSYKGYTYCYEEDYFKII